MATKVNLTTSSNPLITGAFWYEVDGKTIKITKIELKASASKTEATLLGGDSKLGVRMWLGDKTYSEATYKDSIEITDSVNGYNFYLIGTSTTYNTYEKSLSGLQVTYGGTNSSVKLNVQIGTTANVSISFANGGVTGNNSSVTVNVYTPPVIDSFTFVSCTATTITVKPSWTNNSADYTGKDYDGRYIRLDYGDWNTCVSVKGKNGENVTITGLTPGYDYACKLVLDPVQGSNVSTQIAQYSPYVRAVTGSDGVTKNRVYTRKVVFTSTSSTTNSITVAASDTIGDGASIIYGINALPTNDLTSYFSNFLSLTHNTQYTIYAQVPGISDTLVSTTVSTKLLTLVNTGATASQNGVNTTWSSNYGTSFTNGGRVYLSDGVTVASGASTSYASYPNWNISGLKSGTTYIIKAEVTDGVNSVSATVAVTTLSPHVRIYDPITKQYRLAIPYIYIPPSAPINGRSGWCKTSAHIYNINNGTGQWKEMRT